ncbi:hypothetical protein AB0L75_23295 [Streptomyces sp. NPDC052101]|uniref:hypothetical protein n=1 Tax=Streptomyces sp. NPDC052101 TaxID=3155763 RepID=UPI0034257323
MIASRVIRTTLKITFPGIPEKFWWARGMVKAGGKRLAEDVRREYRIDLIEVE